MSDKLLYQSHEADKWFERYIATVSERDSLRSKLALASAWLKAEDECGRVHPKRERCCNRESHREAFRAAIGDGK